MLYFIPEGQLSCSLIGQKADIPVRLTHLGNKVYKAVYTPLIPGTYELQVCVHFPVGPLVTVSSFPDASGKGFSVVFSRIHCCIFFPNANFKQIGKVWKVPMQYSFLKLSEMLLSPYFPFLSGDKIGLLVFNAC